MFPTEENRDGGLKDRCPPSTNKFSKVKKTRTFHACVVW